MNLNPDLPNSQTKAIRPYPHPPAPSPHSPEPGGRHREHKYPHMPLTPTRLLPQMRRALCAQAWDPGWGEVGDYPQNASQQLLLHCPTRRSHQALTSVVTLTLTPTALTPLQTHAHPHTERLEPSPGGVQGPGTGWQDPRMLAPHTISLKYPLPTLRRQGRQECAELGKCLSGLAATRGWGVAGTQPEPSSRKGWKGQVVRAAGGPEETLTPWQFQFLIHSLMPAFICLFIHSTNIHKPLMAGLLLRH